MDYMHYMDEILLLDDHFFESFLTRLNGKIIVFTLLSAPDEFILKMNRCYPLRFMDQIENEMKKLKNKEYSREEVLSLMEENGSVFEIEYKKHRMSELF